MEPAPTHNQPEYSVSEISARVKRVVEDHFGYVRVRGEISKISVNQGSGHAYLTLKDEKSVLDAVCWKGTMSKLKHRPEAGMEVIATGKLTTYPGSSKYQLVIEALEPAGIGALMALLEQRKKQLEKEGLFDATRKKPLPFLPEVIGIVTSPTGAVIRDILHRLADRFPRHVLLWPVAVQGQGAAEQIAAAIRGFNNLREGGLTPPSPASQATPAASGSASGLRTVSQESRAVISRPDVIIVARGGGSIEDLWAFNEEVVVRAVADSAIPIISAVGHETDTTLIDYAADRRAPTPTGAAEFAVPVRSELLSALELTGARMHGAVRKQLLHQHERVSGLARGLPRPQQLVASMAQSLDDMSLRLQGALERWLVVRAGQLQALARLLSPRFLLLQTQRQQQALEAFAQRSGSAIRRMVERREAALSAAAMMLDSLNVLAVMQRGFALVRDSTGTLLTRAAAVADGQQVQLQFHDGARVATIGEGGNIAKAHKKSPAAKAGNQGGLFD